jgi:hypothetical protein
MTDYNFAPKRPRKHAKSVSTICGAVIPLVIVAFGVLIGIGAPHSESDWFGASVLVPVGLALIAAALLAIICSIIAFVRGERAAFLSAITAIPGLLFLLWLIVGILKI